ncbi:hypothetical protein AMTR_s00074p00168940 [Amborella trichopoda]|uniref:Uncharacterized protein n=1 Tax=Amborella trichopoda TaxID=13333 RepID=W1NN22_AMBTC|nr:hypothetical protein AMTR_s00074p00168940 [Amborella trichopoda]
MSVRHFNHIGQAMSRLVKISGPDITGNGIGGIGSAVQASCSCFYLKMGARGLDDTNGNGVKPLVSQVAYAVTSGFGAR